MRRRRSRVTLLRVAFASALSEIEGLPADGLGRLQTGAGATVSAAVLALDNASDATVYDRCGLPSAGRTLRFEIRLW